MLFRSPKLSKATKYGLSIVSYSKQGAKVSAEKSQRKKNDPKISEGKFDKGEDETSYTFENKKAQANVDRGGFERLSYQFNTSKYERLSDKMKKFNTKHLWIKYNSTVLFVWEGIRLAAEAHQVPLVCDGTVHLEILGGTSADPQSSLVPFGTDYTSEPELKLCPVSPADPARRERTASDPW